MSKKTAPPRALAPLPPAEDKLDKVRDGVRRMRDLRARRADLEEQVAETGRLLYELEFSELPSLFDEARVTNIGLEPEGNQPGVVAKVAPYYKANIAADWSEEKKSAAFEWLDKNGHGGLIKTIISVELPRGSRGLAKQVKSALKKLRVPYTENPGVPWNTLTAFVREQIEGGNTVPLDTLGATVGRVVKITEAKEKR